MSKLYKVVVNTADKFVPSTLRPLWEHAAGPKTIFFWAPAFKWGLVVAGLGDLYRPVETLSIPQPLSLAITGLIWSRYSLVIIPKNYNLFAVNMVVALMNIYQALVLTSIDEFRRPLENVSPTQSATLAATGLIWTRYCLVIKPINYALSLCNFSLGIANGVQFLRAYRYHSLKGSVVKN